MHGYNSGQPSTNANVYVGLEHNNQAYPEEISVWNQLQDRPEPW